MTQDEKKQAAAQAALDYVALNSVLGVGTGSTVNYFIQALASCKHPISAAVSSSEASSEQLRAMGIAVRDLNQVEQLDVYIDGADEITAQMHMIKGGGAALTREKIVAAAARQFVCIADDSKQVAKLGAFPLPIEVIPMARTYVARQLRQLGGEPVHREGVITDNGNIILDIHHLDITDPLSLETAINQIPGVVTHGIFAARKADILIVGTAAGERVITA